MVCCKLHPMPESNLITVADAATQTGYSREYIRELARDGVIPSQKVATVVLVDIEALKAHREQSAHWTVKAETTTK